ncbi:MAG: hypothetical protein AB7U49_08450 [Hyphomicrobiaceae bacterium]
MNSIAFAAVAGLVAFAAAPAEAKCTRLGFSVNDYGKDGPTNDAKKLLEKYIADWAAKQGIAKYTIGKKDVKCELFLDFIVFDEHTCRAEADVCWGDGGNSPKKPVTAKADESDPPASTAKPAKTVKAPLTAPARTVAAPTTPAAPATDAERKVVYPATLDAATAAKPSTITTGTISKPKPVEKKPASE